MDSMITAAARALAAGDPLGALKRVALRNDAPALALRGIAMAQLGDFTRAKALVRSAARAFSPRESLARARCVVAEAEIAFASRELNWPTKALANARATLEAHGDHSNAAHATYLEMRHLLLMGRVEEAERRITDFDPAQLPPALRATHDLLIAGIAMRRVHASQAHEALIRAQQAAHIAAIPALRAEVANAMRMLAAPAARLIEHGTERLLTLAEVEQLFASSKLIIDACRFEVRHRDTTISLATRPVLFALVRSLAQASPGDATRDALVAEAFGIRRADESLRARLRVELGRLRQALRAIAEISATKQGFVLVPRTAREIVVLTHPIEEEHASVLALLADGESWSSSSLALALSASQRSMQRALESLAAAGKIQAFGRGRARRWMTPPSTGFTTTLLLPAPLPE
jgi:hypothetical protein